MPAEFLLGCTYNILQADQDVEPIKRFEMVRDTGIFDYINWLPLPDQLSAAVTAAEKTNMPMLTGNYIHQLGRNDEMLTERMRDAARAGVKMLNVMLGTYAADGHELTDAEVVDTYIRTAEVGNLVGVKLSFELHVDCWSEKYKRVAPIVKAVQARGVPFHFTVDYSHVIFKIDNPEQQEISDVREDVEQGRVVLDPYQTGNLCEEWMALDAVHFAQFRPVIPNNPRNVWGENPDGSVPRGIMYPFLKPSPGEWHSPWSAYKLDVCKEAFRKVLGYHLTHDTSPLEYVITEMIATSDYGMGAKFSLLEHNAACGQWIRDCWSQMKAKQAAGIPLHE
ncbi:MAG: xylose isomerase [Alphaproteobacteria bacterium]|nr:xylose isomerase [Alphaproteobacteria bacterium]